MSPLTKTRSRLRMVKMPRCGPPGTQSRRPAGQSGGRLRDRGKKLWVGPRDAGGVEGSGHDTLVVLTQQGEEILPSIHGDAHQPDVLFQERIQLLHHVELLNLGAELSDEALGQGIGHAQLEETGCGEGVAGVLVGGAGGDDAHLGVAHLDAVERAGLGHPGHVEQALLHDHVATGGVAGQHGVLGGGLLEEGDGLHGRAVAQVHHALGVRDAGGSAEDHGCVVRLGQLESGLEELLGFGAIGGLQERDFGELGIVAVVLLVLRAVAGLGRRP